MENININNLLKRDDKVEQIKSILKEFEQNKNTLITKRGLYIYGNPGSGKTTFITNILKELDYDVIKYDAGDIRNKSIIDSITKHNMSDKNIMSLFYKKTKHIAIIMDEIDGMNNGDKGGINSLIKIIRPKKTKKQRLEEITLNPIICIGNYHIDKKIKELMKVCHVLELNSPTNTQMSLIIDAIMPKIECDIKNSIVKFVQGDLKKLNTIYELYKSKQNILNNTIFQDIFLIKSYNNNTRRITKNLINTYYCIGEHLTTINETDRTIVGLLWHENIIDVFGDINKDESVPLYLKMLDNICCADYIDRITFQKQIWQFNEMSSLIKTLKNNKLYHESMPDIKKQKFNPTEVRFTKVLTKYSTEFNNNIFIQNLCQELSMNENDMFAFFLYLKQKHTDNGIINLFENYNITKLDISRIYRYLEKFTKENAPETEDIVSDDDNDGGLQI